jgi:hypothetical protein
MSGRFLTDITGGIFLLGPIFFKGDALSLNIGSNNIFLSSMFSNIVACPIQVK